MDKKTCATCIRGIRFSFSNDILCKKKGVVDRNYSCFAYKEDTELTNKKFYCVNCVNFCTKEDCGSCSIGNCRILTVRFYDGNTRNACSRFVHKIN